MAPVSSIPQDTGMADAEMIPGSSVKSMMDVDESVQRSLSLDVGLLLSAAHSASASYHRRTSQ